MQSSSQREIPTATGRTTSSCSTPSRRTQQPGGAAGAGGGEVGAVDVHLNRPCPADTNNSGVVADEDLVAVLMDWGTDGASNNGDVNGDGTVDVIDLIAIILSWGPCSR